MGLISALAPLFGLSACAEEPEAVQDVNLAVNTAQARDLLDTGIHRYIVVIPVTVCPDPADLHERIDQLMLGDPDHGLPHQCHSLPAGSVLLMEMPGARPTVEYRQFPIEQATLHDGTIVWSDELSVANVQLVKGAATQ